MNGGSKSIPRSASRWALRGITVLAGAAFLLIGIGPHLGWYQTATVLSGSMRPTFAPGDLLVLRPEPISSVRVGQVITYAIPISDHHVESHRVVSVTHRGRYTLVQTKGDANAAKDPWTAVLHGDRAWREAGVVPYAGRLVIWLREPYPHLFSMLLAPILFVLFGLVRIWSKAASGPSGRPAPAPAPPAADRGVVRWVTIPAAPPRLVRPSDADA
jgi:signal peptidase